MANTKQSKKRARQAIPRRARNISARSMMRTYLKKVVSAIEAGNQSEAIDAFKVAEPILDRMANKGLIHKNKAARHKTRLNHRIQALAA